MDALEVTAEQRIDRVSVVAAGENSHADPLSTSHTYLAYVNRVLLKDTCMCLMINENTRS